MSRLTDAITARAKRREGAREFGPDYLRRRYDEDAAFEAVVLAAEVLHPDVRPHPRGDCNCAECEMWEALDHLRDVIGGAE